MTQANTRASYVAINGNPTLNMIATVLTVAAYAVLLYRLNAYYDWFAFVQYPYWLVGRWMIPIISGAAFAFSAWSESYADQNLPAIPENCPDTWLVCVILAGAALFIVSTIYLIGYEIVTNWAAIVAFFTSG